MLLFLFLQPNIFFIFLCSFFQSSLLATTITVVYVFLDYHFFFFVAILEVSMVIPTGTKLISKVSFFFFFYNEPFLNNAIKSLLFLFDNNKYFC